MYVSPGAMVFRSAVMEVTNKVVVSIVCCGTKIILTIFTTEVLGKKAWYAKYL